MRHETGSESVAIRVAVPDDIPATARVFGAAFESYRRGFGVDATTLATLWTESLAARIGSTKVAVLPDGQVAGFVVTVKPGTKEHYRSPRQGRVQSPSWRRALGIRGLWRLPALFAPMGMAYARRGQAKDELYVSLIGVDPAYQGRGIGQALLGAAEAEARAVGAGAVLLHTAASNTRARGAYARAGYALVCTVRAPWVGPAGIRAYVALRKPLRPDPTPLLDALFGSKS